MYCPNCGTNQRTESPTSCAKCAMPLGVVAEQVVVYRAAMPREEAAPAIPKERLIGAAAFLAIAAIPIGLGVKNGLDKRS